MENSFSKTIEGSTEQTITKFPSKSTKHVLLNVGGEKHEISFEILNKFPNSRLGKLSFTPLDDILQHGICDGYNKDKNEYYFCRHPKIFRSILSFYYTGKLHTSDGLCPIAFTEEIKYWGIDESSLDTCCQLKYYQKIQELNEEQELLSKNTSAQDENFGHIKCGRFRKYIWKIFEQPESSLPGKVLNFVDMVCVLICAFILPLTFTFLKNFLAFRVGDIPLQFLRRKRDICAWALIVINVMFIVEFIIRFLVAPQKWRFFKNLLNLMDLLANILVCIIPVISDELLIYMYLVVVILRVLKFARHSTAFQAFLFAIGNSYKEMVKLLLLLIMAILILSRMVYNAEKSEYVIKDHINTFGKAYWWTTVTMNVVGFGEMYFDTALGKLLSITCGLCGLLLTGLPIPIIVENFTSYLNSQKRRLKVLNGFRSLKKSESKQEPQTMKTLSQILNSKSSLVGSMAINICIQDSDFTKKWEHAKLACIPLICVGGITHEFTWNMLNRFQNTRLGKIGCALNFETLSQFCDDFSFNGFKAAFFFHRDPGAFTSILSFYYTGYLHLLEDNICSKEFKAEMEYWMIDETIMERCCYNKYVKKNEYVSKEIKEFQDLIEQSVGEENYGNSNIYAFRKLLWDLLEKRNSTLTGLIYGLISSFITMLSVVILTARTVPDWNSTTENNQIINVTEMCCIIWFGSEYFIRFLTSPDKRYVLFSFLNLIDLFILVLYVFGLIFEDSTKSKYAIIATETCAILRILRLLRILKLGKCSPAIDALAFTLKSSKNELGVLVFFILICVFFFSTVAVLYEMESEDVIGNWFNSDIAETFWWALITMRTVAMDGKLHTRTLEGKFIGFLCGLFGLLFLVLPIPIIANNFVEFYKKKEIEKKKRQ